MLSRLLLLLIKPEKTNISQRIVSILIFVQHLELCALLVYKDMKNYYREQHEVHQILSTLLHIVRKKIGKLNRHTYLYIKLLDN